MKGPRRAWRLDEDEREAFEFFETSPARNWTVACGMARPRWYTFWRWFEFAHLVALTQNAMRRSLRLDGDLGSYPLARGRLEDGEWTITVRTWGKP